MSKSLSQSSRVRFAEQHNDEIEECKGEHRVEHSEVSREVESESITAALNAAAAAGHGDGHGHDSSVTNKIEKSEKSENSTYGRLLRALCDSAPLSESACSVSERDGVQALIDGLIPEIRGMIAITSFEDFISQFRESGDVTKKTIALAMKMASRKVLLPPTPLELLHNINVNFEGNKAYVKPANTSENSSINQSISVLNKSGLMAAKPSSCKADHIPKVDFLESDDISRYGSILADLLCKYGTQTGYKPILPVDIKTDAALEMAAMIKRVIPREGMGMTLAVTDVESMFTTLRIVPRYIKQGDIAPLFKKAVAVQQKIILGYPIYAPESKMFALYKAQSISEDRARLRTTMNVTRICYIGFVYLLYYLAEDIFNRVHKIGNRADKHQEQISAPGTYDVHIAAEEIMSRQLREKRKAMVSQSNTGSAGSDGEMCSTMLQTSEGSTFKSTRCEVEDIENPYGNFKTPDNIVELDIFGPVAYLWRCIYVYSALLDREFSNPDMGLGLVSPRPLLVPNLREYPECIRVMTKYVPTIKKAFASYSLKSPVIDCCGLIQLLKLAKINHVINYKFAFEVVMRNYSGVDKDTFIPGLNIEEFIVALFVCANYAYSREPIIQTLQTPEMRLEHLILQISGKK